MTPQIHPTAVISPDSHIGADVSIGPFAIVEPDVSVGDGCVLAAHTVVKSGTKMGSGNQLHEGAVLGGIPQHLGLTDEMGGLIIGDGNIFRENATVHRAYLPDQNTVVGNRNMVMINAHIAHDCIVEDEAIFANNVMLAGHVEIGTKAYISGAVGIHQFCRIGRQAMVGGQARVTRDVPPYITIDGLSNSVVGLNLIGLRRSGMSTADIRQLKDAYRIIYRQNLSWDETIETLRSTFTSGPAADYAPFMQAAKRGIVQQRNGREFGDDVAAVDKAAETPKTPMKVRFPGGDESAA